MNDVFMEYMLKKKKDRKDITIIALLAVAAVILTLALCALMMAIAVARQSGQGVFSIGFVLIAGVWYGFYLLFGMRSVEYEYILTNSEIDIDKIMSKKSRKRLASFDFKSAETVACIKDEMYNAPYKNKTVSDVIDACGDKEKLDVYFVDVIVDDKLKRVLFQPTSKMLEAIRKFNPRKIHIYEGN